jgi:MFS family permease
MSAVGKETLTASIATTTSIVTIRMSEEPNYDANRAFATSSSGAPQGRWLNRNVLGMGLTSLLSDASHEMATAVLGGFLEVIGAPKYALGVIEGVADALSSFVKLAAGWYSDRIGRRKTITTAGYALTGVAFALLAAAASWPMVLFCRALGWFGRGIRGPLRDAILAESVHAADRGKAFGFHRAGDTIGAILGPLLAAGLMYWLAPLAADNPSGPFRIVFLVTLLPGLGAALAFALMVHEKRRAADPTMSFWASIRGLPGGFRRLLVGVGVFGAGDFSHTLLIMAAAQMLSVPCGPVAAAQIAAMLYALRNTLYAAASYPIGALSDRYGRRALLVLGYFLAVVVMLGFVVLWLTEAALSLPWTLVALALLFSLAGVYIAAEDSLEGALTADYVPDTSARGAAYGVMGAVNGLGDFLSSAIVGLLWTVHPAAGFAYAAAMMFLGAVLLMRVR